MHDLAPAPNGWKAVFAAGDRASAEAPSFEAIQRWGLNLLLVSLTKKNVERNAYVKGSVQMLGSRWKV